MTETSLARRTDRWPGRMTEWFDLFEWPSLTSLFEGDRLIRIEEKHEGDALVISAEMPGVDPEKDVEITVRDHILRVRAERREEKTTDEDGKHRSEFRYGTFFRAIPLPPDAKEGDVEASYRDGILEVRVPCAPAAKETAQRVPVTRK
jgi:HSP20 family protein